MNNWRAWKHTIQASETHRQIYDGQESLKHTFTFMESLSSITMQHQGQPVSLWHLLFDALNLTDVAERLQ